MKKKSTFCGLFLLFFFFGTGLSQTVRLYPENERYLEYKGEPVILITSAEHYGAVLNLDFDYRLYLKTLKKHGIVVEVTLFTSIYAKSSWELSPFHKQNNVNGVGDLDYHLVNTPYNGGLELFQENYIRKVVEELNEFDNLFFEIQNEPWADNPNLAAYVNMDDDAVFTSLWQKKVEVANRVALEWQAWVASVIRETESNLPESHLIAQNISNFQFDQEKLPGNVSMINFHYAFPDAALLNQDIGGVIGLDETGFMPHEDHLYLNQAWRFILSGGGLYNNLDYSFTVGNEKGLWHIPDSNPGWGGPEFRKKLSYLVDVMDEVPFHEMEVSEPVLHASGDLKQYGLSKPGEVYLVFLEYVMGVELVPTLPGAEYDILWMNVDTGEKKESRTRLTANSNIHSPFESEEVVLLIRKVK